MSWTRGPSLCIYHPPKMGTTYKATDMCSHGAIAQECFACECAYVCAMARLRSRQDDRHTDARMQIHSPRVRPARICRLLASRRNMWMRCVDVHTLERISTCTPAALSVPCLPPRFRSPVGTPAWSSFVLAFPFVVIVLCLCTLAVLA